MDPKLDNLAIRDGARSGIATGANADRSVPPVSKSLPQAAAAFAVSMARFAASGFKTVDQPLHDLRVSHCQPCEYLQGSQCTLCRCFVGKKAWLPHEDCPVGRWTA